MKSMDYTTDKNTPQIFIVGAMKSGTTTLHRMLDLHPDIFMSGPKEPCFFAGREHLEKIWPEILSHPYSHDYEAYLSLFSKARKEQLCGESSTAYAKYPIVPGVPARIYNFRPDARILFILRDPVERMISQYWHSVRNDYETRQLDELVKIDPQYVAFSKYSMQIEQYLAFFPREQIYVITLESLQDKPNQILSMLFEWLGLQPIDIDHSSDTRAHTTPLTIARSRKISFLEHIRYSRAWDIIGPRTPNWFRTLGRHMSEETIDRSTFSAEEFRKKMSGFREEQIHLLADLLQRDFPEWQSCRTPE